MTRVGAIRREWWHDGGRHSHCCGEDVKITANDMTNRSTHGKQLGEGPFQVEASCLEVEGKADHRDREASSQVENQDQAGKAAGLREVVRAWITKVQGHLRDLRPPNPGGGPPNPPGGGPMPMGGPFIDGGGPRC